MSEIILKTKKKTLDINEILDILPHRYPFVFVDKVLNCDEEGIETCKNVTYNEPYFSGHFPGRSIMPGVIQIEAVAQSVCLWAYLNMDIDFSKDLVYFMGVDSAKFKRPVMPGDTLIVKGQKKMFSKYRGSMTGEIYVDEKLVTEVTIKAAIRYDGIKELSNYKDK